MCKRCAWSKLGEFCCIARNPLLHYDYFNNLSNQPVFLPISHGGVKQRGKNMAGPAGHARQGKRMFEISCGQ